MRKAILLSALTLCLISPAALAERLATSGNFTVDLDNPPGDAIWSSNPTDNPGNILLNLKQYPEAAHQFSTFLQLAPRSSSAEPARQVLREMKAAGIAVD